jgi:hypothetical protein
VLAGEQLGRPRLRGRDVVDGDAVVAGEQPVAVVQLPPSTALDTSTYPSSASADPMALSGRPGSL